jgi:molybdopterin converting factor small subunit
MGEAMQSNTITLKAFSFLQPEFRKKGLAADENSVSLCPGDTVNTVLKRLKIDSSLVEGSFINGSVRPLDTELNPGDRVALVPPGTPGPYRFILGISAKRDQLRDAGAHCGCGG